MHTSHIRYVRYNYLLPPKWEKITTKEGKVRYWLGEHLLEVYSVHQHGEGELIEKETIEMQLKNKPLFNDEEHHRYSDDLQSASHQQTVNRKVKCRNLSSRACIQVASGIYVTIAYCHRNGKNHHERR